MRYVSSNTDLDEPASGAWRNTSAGMVAATHGKVSRPSLFTIVAVLWTPLRQFALAPAPACGAGALFWLECGRTIGERRQRLLRGLAVLVAGVAIVACAAGT
jgi:hypothetical protein